ncbi:ATP-dependent RNA helicase DDX51 [Amphibalanus amphitrite]|uniref:ATP-dependent RNA helicase DDX51 n=1 Tax=Amphibalanus amphitrite TaxID=1232801 RepID=A0A6A4X0N5_AMPAM|nr:ATP-dependent RNA helicase DDX51 [Amphibalanus amphitrite]
MFWLQGPQDLQENPDLSKQTSMTVSTIVSDQKMSTSVVSGVTIENEETGTRQELPPLYTLNTIPVTEDDIPTVDDVRRWPYLLESGVTVSDEASLPVGLLIGGNAAVVMEPLRFVKGEDGGPYATLTRFRWILGGLKNVSSRCRVNRIKVNENDPMAEEWFENRAEIHFHCAVFQREWSAAMESQRYSALYLGHTVVSSGYSKHMIPWVVKEVLRQARSEQPIGDRRPAPANLPALYPELRARLAAEGIEQVFLVQYDADTPLCVQLLGGDTVARGGANWWRWGRAARPPWLIVVSTPGWLMDHITSAEGFSLPHLRYLVIDEADRVIEMAETGWLKAVERVAAATARRPASPAV